MSIRKSGSFGWKRLIPDGALSQPPTGGFCLAVGFLVLSLGCASPIPELWPPEPDDPSRRIIVSVDTWHSMIALPRVGAGDPGLPGTHLSSSHAPQSSAAVAKGFGGPPEPRRRSGSGAQAWLRRVLTPQSSLYEEWGYAEHAWYLEGRQGVIGVLRSLFWASPGVIEVTHSNQVWGERTPQPPASQFTFGLSEQGFLRLREYLEASKASNEPLEQIGQSRFYRSTRAYHVFHHCHQYTARALREAGLPVSTFWALTRGMFAAQLRRAARIAEQPATGGERSQALE